MYAHFHRRVAEQVLELDKVHPCLMSEPAKATSEIVVRDLEPADKVGRQPGPGQEKIGA